MCSSSARRAGPADARGSASRSTPHSGSHTAPPSTSPRRPLSAVPTPCPGGDRPGPPARLPRSAAGSGGTDAPSNPATPRLQIPIASRDPNASTAPRTSPSYDPAAMSSGSSPSSFGAVLKPDNSCATSPDNSLAYDTRPHRRLTGLRNVVAYSYRPSSRKDRHDVHQHRRFAAAIVVGRLQSARPWLPNDRRKGRKGRKPLSRAPIAVRKNSRSPRPAPEQYRVVFLQIGPIP